MFCAYFGDQNNLDKQENYTKTSTNKLNKKKRKETASMMKENGVGKLHFPNLEKKGDEANASNKEKRNRT